MKKYCIIILSFMLLFAACQPTPENTLIVGKDQEQMIEKAQGDTAYATDAPEAAVSWAQRLGAPDRYTANLTSAGGHLTAGVLIKLLEEGKCPFAGVILAYSPLDLRPKAAQAPATPRDEAMQVRGAAYEELALRGNDAIRYDHVVSPLLTAKQLLQKLPRMMVISAQLCEFKEQDEEFAAMISRIGVETTSCRFMRSAHGFMPHFRQEWKEASLRTARFIRSC